MHFWFWPKGPRLPVPGLCVLTAAGDSRVLLRLDAAVPCRWDRSRGWVARTTSQMDIACPLRLSMLVLCHMPFTVCPMVKSHSPQQPPRMSAVTIFFAETQLAPAEAGFKPRLSD